MLDVRTAHAVPRSATAVATTVVGADDAAAPLGPPPAGTDEAELADFLRLVRHKGGAGSVHTWVRPGGRPARVLLAGVGDRTEADWRRAGAALARRARRESRLPVLLPPDVAADELRGLAEGLWLGTYRFRLGDDTEPAALRRVTLVRPGADQDPTGDVLARARTTARMIMLARDLTNSPSDRKTPDLLARRLVRAARGVPGVTVTVREPDQLAVEGFGGLLAVGGGSAHGPRLVQIAYRPRNPAGPTRHVVLVGKGITFDTGGICVKTRDGMKIMRKDMGGAAAVAAATLGAAEDRLPLRVTAVLPLAENMLSGTAMRPGDVVRHYGGMTTEVRNTDAEGRLVLADALQYAGRRLRPDLVVDLATLTGAQAIALGKRTAALFSDDDTLAGELADAAVAAGEQVWRLPLPDDYLPALSGEHTDLVNSTDIGGGAVMAALFLREFAGDLRDRWAHLDMSAPAWADKTDGEFTKGATGWGVRTLLHWLRHLTPTEGSDRAAVAARDE